MLPKRLLAFLTAGALYAAPGVCARNMNKHQMWEKQMEAAKRWHVDGAVKRASGGVQNITFTNPKASGEFLLFILFYCYLTRQELNYRL